MASRENSKLWRYWGYGVLAVLLLSLGTDSFGPTDGSGAGLGFYDCQPAGYLINLGGMRYPDGATVGTGAPGPKWNDLISSFENNQTPGTATSFFNWTGSWTNVLDSYAFDQVGNLRYSARGDVNDIIDGVHVCTQ